MSVGQRRRRVKRQWGPYGGAPVSNDQDEACPPTAWRDDGEKENENENEHENEHENENENEHENENENENENEHGNENENEDEREREQEREGYARMMSLMVTVLRCRPPSAL